MHKTTVYLPAELKKAVQRMAKETRLSEAELIRQAIGEKVAQRARPRPRVPLGEQGLGDPTAAERVDDLLEGFGRR